MKFFSRYMCEIGPYDVYITELQNYKSQIYDVV